MSTPNHNISIRNVGYHLFGRIGSRDVTRFARFITLKKVNYSYSIVVRAIFRSNRFNRDFHDVFSSSTTTTALLRHIIDIRLDIRFGTFSRRVSYIITEVGLLCIHSCSPTSCLSGYYFRLFINVKYPSYYSLYINATLNTPIFIFK